MTTSHDFAHVDYYNKGGRKWQVNIVITYEQFSNNLNRGSYD